MTQTIILIRHGKAQPADGTMPDEERPLIPAGLRALRAWLPQALSTREVRNADSLALWASPTQRTRQTAEVVLNALPASCAKGVSIVEQEFLHTQDYLAFEQAVRACDNDAIIVAGHNPFIEDATKQLTGAEIPFATGGIAAMRLPKKDSAEPGRLLWFLQGPEWRHWDTLCQLETAIAKAADTLDRRHTDFIAQPEDVETVHRLRISIRTLRSLLAFVRPYQKNGQNEAMEQDLRDLVAATSHLRELDVLLNELGQMNFVASDLIEAVQLARNEECTRTIDFFSSKKAQKAFARVAKNAAHIQWENAIEKNGLARSTVRKHFEKFAASTHREIAEVNLADTKRMHTARKHAKQVRYTAERLRDLLGDEALETAKSMEAQQDRLGELCDAVVNIDIIENFPLKDLSREAQWDLSLLKARNEEHMYNMLRLQTAPEQTEETAASPTDAPSEQPSASA